MVRVEHDWVRLCFQREYNQLSLLNSSALDHVHVQRNIDEAYCYIKESYLDKGEVEAIQS